MKIGKSIIILGLLVIGTVQGSEDIKAFSYSMGVSFFQSSTFLVGTGFGLKAVIGCYKKEPIKAFKDYCVFKVLVDSVTYLQGCKNKRLNTIQDETRRNNYRFYSSLIGYSAGIGLCGYGLYKTIGGLPQLKTALL